MRTAIAFHLNSAHCKNLLRLRSVGADVLAAKRAEIAREAFPRATLVGIAFDALSREQGDVAAEAARKLGLEPRIVEVKGEQGYGRAFGADDAPGQPIILPAGPMFLRDRAAIAQPLLERRIPSITAFRVNMEAGALIANTASRGSSREPDHLWIGPQSRQLLPSRRCKLDDPRPRENAC